MYIRFVIHRKDEDSGRRIGLFQVCSELLETNALTPYEEQQLRELRVWFNQNLKKPKSFAKSKKPNARGVAISWFKDTAGECISRMYEMKSLMEAHGITVDVIRTSRPGYVVYEDDHQVTAEPYFETQT